MMIQNISQEFGSENLELLKRKNAYPYHCIDSFENLSEKKCFYRSLKDKTTNDKGEKLDGHMIKNIWHLQKSVMNLT